MLSNIFLPYRFTVVAVLCLQIDSQLPEKRNMTFTVLPTKPTTRYSLLFIWPTREIMRAHTTFPGALHSASSSSYSPPGKFLFIWQSQIWCHWLDRTSLSPLEHHTSRTNRSTVTVQYKDRHTHTHSQIHRHTYIPAHTHARVHLLTCTHIHTHMCTYVHAPQIKPTSRNIIIKKCWKTKTKEKPSKQQRPLRYHTGKTWGGSAATYHRRDGSIERKEILINMLMLISKKIFCNLFFCEN